MSSLQQLADVIASRTAASPDTSYTAQLLGGGVLKIAQKVGEEGVEVALAAVAQTPRDLVNESVDLLYHLLVLWQACGVPVADIEAEIERRLKK